LLRLHRNLGHLSPREFARALSHAGVKPELVQWARHQLRCSVCHERRHPQPPRPGMLPRALRFNQVVGADLVELDLQDVLPSAMGATSRWLLNVVCWGTGLQMAAFVPDKQSITMMQAFAALWTKHYGVPELLVCDQGAEFTGSAFAVGTRGSWCTTRTPPHRGRTGGRSGPAAY